MAKVPRVIIIDPDRESAVELQKMLQLIGFEVLASAGYGVEAFTLALQLRPDLVLLRVEEPLVRPIQTLVKLNDGMPDLPIIVYSTEANIRLMRQSMVGGASDYLQEPLTEEELEASILRVLERKEREMARRRGELEDPVPQGTIVTVFGAKGGIGKTTIASNLAVALAMDAHQTVALVDMDTRFGDVAITMDIPVERSIADLARNLHNIDRVTLRDYLVEHESGVRILPAPTRPSDWRNLTAAHIRDVVDVLAQTHDFVVLDTPGTFNEIVAAAIEVGTIILLITTLDMASIKDTVLALEMLHERFGNDEERIKVILNRAGMDTGVKEKDVERTLDSPLWWKIPQDIDVMKAGQLGRPIVMSRPNSKAAVEMREIARALAGIRNRNRAAKGGGLGRLIRPLFKRSA
ncbi:MAG: P-loop NTPase [Chloroflexota bacterium]|mgnify:FL=1|jgi:pilus assembly protein CpaE|nr:P-loop NTPase [Dehalococcoidia bacterium]MDW8046022.1 P-loop NTPase [Chloroflexota bacterium]